MSDLEAIKRFISINKLVPIIEDMNFIYLAANAYCVERLVFYGIMPD